MSGIAKFTPDGACKCSGVDWQRQVSVHGEVQRIGNVAVACPKIEVHLRSNV